MPKIHRLPQNVINKIAAGEVVERPASILKELLENSLDAHATQINIEVVDGGKTKILVQDNGEGLSKEDIQLAIQPHTTSKIQDVDDLNKLETFGFRGEALASIASVCHFTMKSKQSDSSGYELKVKDGEILEAIEAALAPGTIVEVSNIFYNVPARKKFLKSDQTELRNLLDVFMHIAIINPNVSYK